MPESITAQYMPLCSTRIPLVYTMPMPIHCLQCLTHVQVLGYGHAHRESFAIGALKYISSRGILYSITI